MGLDYFASAPTMVLPSTHIRQRHLRYDSVIDVYRDSMIDNDPAILSLPLPIEAMQDWSDAAPKAHAAETCTSRPVASRKRSRDDVGDEVFGDGNEAAAILAPVQPAAEPIYGPGMTLIYPDTPQLNISAESQTGTWVEERESVKAKTDAMIRPKLSARKSQRRSQENTGDFASAIANQPIDPIVRHLGIGWCRVAEMSPATAGQQAFVRNQFGFNEPEILLQHEGMGIYIIRSKPSSAAGYWDQYWLFTEDLKSCQFLCHDEDSLFRRLSNKRQDERGNWHPDILVEGPVVRAKDCPLSTGSMAMDGMEGFTAITGPTDVLREVRVETCDVEMLL